MCVGWELLGGWDRGERMFEQYRLLGADFQVLGLIVWEGGSNNGSDWDAPGLDCATCIHT